MDARICPRCEYDRSRVYDVRDQDGGITLRRRKCPRCGRKWQTVELERWQYEDLLKEAMEHGDGRKIR